MQPVRSLQPAEEAERMAEFLLEEDGVREQILSETIESAASGRIRESGRTVCGSGDVVLPPHLRFPKAVELQRCPVGAGRAGIIHSHVTRPELMNPQHSIPDTSNVILVGNVAASMVVGLETSEILLAPDDPEAAKTSLERALGVPADSPEEVQAAIDRGQIESFQAVRRRLKRELSGLFREYDTPEPELKARLDEIVEPSSDAPGTRRAALPTGGPAVACAPARWLEQTSHTSADTTAGQLRRRQSRCAAGLRQSASELDFRQRVADQVVGTIIGLGVTRGLEALLYGPQR